MRSEEETHWRLPALLAALAGFTGRGVSSIGAPADIVVYDYEELNMLRRKIVHDLWGVASRRVQRARDHRYVLVNGAITIKNDHETNTFSGRRLRGTGSRDADHGRSVSAGRGARERW